MPIENKIVCSKNIFFISSRGISFFTCHRNMKIKKIFYCIAFIFAFNQVNAQDIFKQTLKGTVVDATIQIPLFGAKITLAEDSNIHVVADINGKFRIDSLPAGRYTLLCNVKKYEAQSIDVLLTSAKEEEVTFYMRLISFNQVKKVAVKGIQYNKPVVNDMAPISSHSFGVAETQNFAAAVNDPGRMATSFAGVVGSDDGSNAISIRGNAPNGLLWRMEGIDIPAPNHFQSFDGASGGITLISSQLLAQSDFYTGAFSPEYGNALSGVFDLKMRKGNSEKKEHTFQVGVLGVDLATEGPLSKKGGSYLINYRYSTLDLLSKIGFDLFGGLLTFQDLSFNLVLPKTKAGEFTVFGMGGLSSQKFNNEKDSSKWESTGDRFSFDFVTNTGILGLTHQIQVGKSSTWRNVLAVSGSKVSDISYYTQDNYEDFESNNQTVENKRLTFNSVLTKRFNKHNTIRAGAYLNTIDFGAISRNRDYKTNEVSIYANSAGTTSYAQSFVQWKYRPVRKWSFISGLHYMILGLNNKQTIEPRFSAIFKPKRDQSISLGLGMHSQMQLPAVYFTGEANSGQTNKQLDFNKAIHAVLGYEKWFTAKFRAKAEVYYQHLYNIPISTDPTSNYSLLNLDWEPDAQNLVNKGLGANQGLELTVEKLLQKRFYGMATLSVYDSKYKAQSDKWFNTRYNGSFASTTTFGKEFKLRRNGNLLGLNFKSSWYGGLRQTPVDIEESILQDETVRMLDKPFSEQLPNYFRLDIKLSYRINHKKFNSWWSLDLQNATNRKNIGGSYFDIEKKATQYWYTTPLLPILSYKIEF